MKYEISNRFDAFLMPAYALDTDKLLYGKLGYSTAKLKYTQGADPAVSLSGFESATQLNGFILAMGYKQTIQDGIYGFVEANHIEYGRKNISGSGSVQGNEIRFNSSPSVTVNNILVGIGYNFGYAN
jgi:outer membrane immunogenic protein